MKSPKKSRSTQWACGFLAVLLCGTACAAAAPLRAAVAKVDITPPTGFLMWGYAARKAPSTGTLDPLWARVLVLDDSHTRIAVVAVDLGRSFGPPALRRLNQAVRRSSGVIGVLVAASHTHSGPVVLDEYREGAPAWENVALDKIRKAVDQASAQLAEVWIGVGYGVSYIGYNRIEVRLDGKAKWLGSNGTEIPSAPLDPTVAVVRLDRPDGSPLAILVNYACHPVIFGADNLQYSADFPAALTQAVEEAVDGRPLCFFLQGAPGDINPYHASTPLREDAVRLRDLAGRHLGEEAARVAKTIPTQTEAEGHLDYAEDILKVPLRWEAEKFREGLLRVFGANAFDVYGPVIAPEIDLPVSTLVINKRLAVMTMPGEPFVDFQMDWRNRCPAPDSLFLGYTNGYYGYFPTIRAAARGGYGASSSTTWVQVGAGEQMVNRALVRVHEMLGALHPAPAEVQ